MTTIGDLLVEFSERPTGGAEPPVLTLTERNGFVRQADRFHKRLATEDTSRYKVVRRSDIAFNPYLLWAGALAQNTIVDEGLISPLYPTFRVRDGFDPRYVARLLLTEPLISAYDSIAFGSVPRRRRSSVRDFLSLSLPSQPSLNDQRRIAAILDQADALRAKRRESLALLDELVESVLGGLITAEDWQMRPFSEVCERVTVGVVVKPASYYVEKGVPALRTLNVKPGRIDMSDLVFFSEASNIGPLAKSRLRAGDVVISRTGKAGTAAVVPPNLIGANAIDLLVISPDHDLALPVYLEALINSPHGKRIVAGEARGQIQQHFNVGSLRKALIPVPPMGVQDQFAQTVERINAQRAAAQRSLDLLDELFASLQARAFSGQL